MNLYFVYADNLHYTEVIGSEIGGPSYSDGCIAVYVYADTPGQAKSMVLTEEAKHYSHVEFTDLHAYVKRRNVGDRYGITSIYTDRLAAEIAGVPEEDWPKS